MLTYFRGTNMVHHIAGPRVNAAATIGFISVKMAGRVRIVLAGSENYGREGGL